MLKVKLRHLNVVEGELNAASEDALRVAIPIRADCPEGDRAVLQPALAKGGQNTEQRWLGRMVSNTLGEIRKRGDLCDSKGAMLKVDIETETVEVEKLLDTKKRKLAEISELKDRVDAIRKKVLVQVSSNCLKEIKALRPLPPTSHQDQQGKAVAAEQQQQQAAAAMQESAILTQVPPLQERARVCVEELGMRSEQLAARIESLRTTITAVSNFLKGAPSKVEKAIRQSHRKGVEGEGRGVEEVEREEQGSAERRTRRKKGSPSPATSPAAAASVAPSSAISMLAAHLGQS
ncbi:Hypothetical protein NocV09_00102430 [Nannochloropsis oceanica]